MKLLAKNHTAISTVLAFALIPLSGFATDIYLPSFPAMAKFFGTTQADVQLTLVVFVVSSGIGQLFVGSIVDSFGRYRLSLAALAIFALTSILIAISSSIVAVLIMRVVQGLTIALIVVSKRAFIMDTHTGEKLKHYTSLFSIIWATAPIVAPFIGGFLQFYLGWQSNFYFLAAVTSILIALELAYSGETIKESHTFNLRPLMQTYSGKLAIPDFTAALFILGLCYSLVIMFNIASPFIIEHVFEKSSVTTGNITLLSGVAILIGGLLSKSLIHKPMFNKMIVAGPLFILLSVVLFGITSYAPDLNSMMTAIFLIHIISGFTFNTFYSYAFTRFSTHAGIVSGLTGGGTYIITSVASYAVTSILGMKDPVALAVGYLTISSMILCSLLVFGLIKRGAVEEKNNITSTIAISE